jgi:starvation-inducible DNA-binding protein
LTGSLAKWASSKTLSTSQHKEEIEMTEALKMKKKTGVPGPATKMVDRMYPNRVDLSDKVKQQVVEAMQVTLAAASDMYSQSKFAHWNVKGDNFYQLHLVFDHVAEVIEAQVDPIAERITQLGGVANGTVRQASCGSVIPEYPVETINGMDHVRALADSLGVYCKTLRDASEKIDDIGDKPSADFFNQMIVDAEEQLYFLESHLEAGDVQ